MTVLELAPVLMGRQLDEDAGQMIKSISEGQGIAIHTGVNIVRIDGDERAAGVVLEDGTIFPAQLVVISAGVRANAALAGEAGAAVDRAVIVNEKMETSAADIYACGDCAQLRALITPSGRRPPTRAKWPAPTPQGTALSMKMSPLP